MISTLLVEHAALVPVAMLLVASACVAVGCLVLRLHPGRQRALWLLVGLSLAPVVALTLTPTSRRAVEVCAGQFAVPSLGSVELLANVALFFPPAYFAALATRRPMVVLAAGVVLSAGLEAFQAAVPALGRSCDANDWAMNTIGTVLAVLVAAATLALTARPGVRRAAAPRSGPTDRVPESGP